MKDDELKVKIIDIDDEKSFNELLAKLQVSIVMKLCPPELRMQILDNALKILKAN
jgi:saccharopine dehydrogenase-like NADP-dependent oxidoreductase